MSPVPNKPRPPLPERKKTVLLRFSDDEYTRLAQAHQLGREPWSKLGAWARRVLLAALPLPPVRRGR